MKGTPSSWRVWFCFVFFEENYLVREKKGKERWRRLIKVLFVGVWGSWGV